MKTDPLHHWRKVLTAGEGLHYRSLCGQTSTSLYSVMVAYGNTDITAYVAQLRVDAALSTGYYHMCDVCCLLNLSARSDAER